MCALNISWLNNTRTQVQQQISLLQGVLAGMKALRSDPAAKAPEWFDALRVLSAALASGVKPASLGADEWHAAEQEWDALRKLLGDNLPDTLKPLTLKLSELGAKTIPPSSVAGLVSYPLVTFNPQQPGQAAWAGLSFQTSLSASGLASAAIESDVKTPQWAAQMGYVLPDADCFFRIGLQGALGAGGTIKATPTWGAIGGAVSGNGQMHLDYGFNYASSWYVAQAFAHSLDVLPAPGQLDQMLAVCRETEFCLVSLDVKGIVNLKGELSAGQALVSTVASLNAKPVTLGAKLSATLSADWSLEGDYQLTVRRDKASPVVRLERQINRSTGASIDVSAKVGLDGARAALDPLMQEILPTAQPLIQKLGSLSDPRQLALDAANEALHLTGGGRWDACCQKLLDVASGGGKPAQVALAKALKDTIADASSAYLSAGVGAFKQASSDIADHIKAALPEGVPFEDKLKAAVDTLFGELQQRIDGAIGQLGNELAGLSGPAAEQVARLLNLPANSLASFGADLQKGVQTAIDPVAAWLSSYQAARDRVGKAIGQLQTRKLALDLAASYRRDTDRSTLLEVQFATDSADARALYEAFWIGQLDQYPRLMRNCEREGSANERRNVFTQSQDTSRGFGFALNVFDLLQVDANSKIMDKVVVSSSNGRINAARDTASLSSHVGVNGDSSETSLTINLEMLAVTGAPPPLDAEFKASGDALTPAQLNAFFSLLEATDVVSRGTAARVNDFLFAGAAGTANRVAQASIAGTCALDLAAWATLLKAPAAQLGDAVRAACMQALTAAVEVGAERGQQDGKPADWLAYWRQYTHWSEIQFWATAKEAVNGVHFADAVFLAVADGEDPVSTSNPLDNARFRNTLHRLWEIQRIADGASAAWKAVEAEHGLFNNLSALPQTDSDQVYDKLCSLSKTIARGLSKAFVFDVPDIKQPVKVSWRFLGLTMALSRLAAPQQPVSFVTQVTVQDHGEPVARLFA
jgi:hypothetical protein